MPRRALVSFSLGFAALTLGHPAFALLAEPREYNGWILQDWGQAGQDEHRRGLYQPPFELPEGSGALWAHNPPVSSSERHWIPGQVAVQYYPSSTNKTYGGFGWAVNFRNVNNSTYDSGFVDFRALPAGGVGIPVASYPLLGVINPANPNDLYLQSLPCRAEGTPMLLKPLASGIEGTVRYDIGFVIGSVSECLEGDNIQLYIGVIRFCQESTAGQQGDYYSQCKGGNVPAGTDVYNAQLLGGGLGNVGSNRTFPNSPVYGQAAWHFADVQADYAGWVDECGNYIDCNESNTLTAAECSPGRLYAFKEKLGEFDWEPAWYPVPFVELKTGEPSCRPPPLGQPPPEPMRYFRTITSPSVYKTDLLVIGAALNYPGKKYSYEENSSLLALDPKTGAFRWAFDVPGELIVPEPIILDSVIIFGTNKGRAFALNHNGTLRWGTSPENRVTYQTAPYTAPALQAAAALYGPAVQLSQAYAYFGGSDGRIHRFDTQSGERKSSGTLAYYKSVETDANGLRIIKPTPIRTPPAVGGNDFLIAKVSTENEYSQQNGSFLMAVRIPDLAFNPRIAPVIGTYCIDPAGGVFTNAKGAVSYGGLPLGPYVGMYDDPVWHAYYVDNPGYYYYLGKDQHDRGGVSLADGYAFATNRGGQAMGVPSCRVRPKEVDVGHEQLPLVPPTLDLPAPPGPIRVYPNPFDPAKAVNGAVKFRNLPRGSRIEISTLAHERIAVLYENGNRADWNGRNEVGQDVASGVYIYRIIQPDGAPPVTGQIALIRR